MKCLFTGEATWFDHPIDIQGANDSSLATSETKSTAQDAISYIPLDFPLATAGNDVAGPKGPEGYCGCAASVSQ